MSDTPTPPQKKERRLKSHPTHPHASLVIYIYNVQFQIFSMGNDITIELYFKHILFISTWVLDNLMEKYEIGS